MGKESHYPSVFGRCQELGLPGARGLISVGAQCEAEHKLPDAWPRPPCHVPGCVVRRPWPLGIFRPSLHAPSAAWPHSPPTACVSSAGSGAIQRHDDLCVTQTERGPTLHPLLPPPLLGARPWDTKVNWTWALPQKSFQSAGRTQVYLKPCLGTEVRARENNHGAPGPELGLHELRPNTSR